MIYKISFCLFFFMQSSNGAPISANADVEEPPAVHLGEFVLQSRAYGKEIGTLSLYKVLKGQGCNSFLLTIFENEPQELRLELYPQADHTSRRINFVGMERGTSHRVSIHYFEGSSGEIYIRSESSKQMFHFYQKSEAR